MPLEPPENTGVTEEYGKIEFSFGRDGATATRCLICDWWNRTYWTPAIGTKLDGYNLYVERIKWEGLGKPLPGTIWPNVQYDKCRITIEYTSTPVDPAALPSEALEFSAEVLEIGIGRQWVSQPTDIVDQSQSILFPTVEYTLETRITAGMWGIERPRILGAVGTVNDSGWKGAPAGCMLFEGASSKSEWDEYTNLLYRTTYKFLYRPVSHNMVWRLPRQKRDANGALMWKVNAGGFWIPDYEPAPWVNPDGSLWDEMVPALYAYSDFTLLGLGA